MISKARSRFIKSLQVKKYRLAEQSFIVQGAKVVKETLASDFEVRLLAGTASFLHEHLQASERKKAEEVTEVTEDELVSLGSVESNHSALAVVRMKKEKKLILPEDSLTIMLDDIRDPGNLGTMIRTADWFGLTQIVASPETADCFNPKVVNATMGSFLRVNVAYRPLTELLSSTKLPVLGTFLKGEDVHSQQWPRAGLLVIGNESRGISQEVAAFVNHRITIPGYGKAESLNASTALAVVLDNYRRTL